MDILHDIKSYFGQEKTVFWHSFSECLSFSDRQVHIVTARHFGNQVEINNRIT